MSKKIKIGVFGFGCVGQGLYNVLEQTEGIQAEIARICVKDCKKSRSLDSSFFTFDKEDILNDDEIQLVVELIDDPIVAYEIVKRAIKSGKAVVSANKKMVAENLKELKQLQEEYKVPFLYEASCCASIPIIRNLEEYYDNDLLRSITGIFNGSTNFILSKIIEEGKSFEHALKEAQEKGFAETNPALDIQGFDPKFKLCILLAHSFGLFIEPKEIFNYGIEKISSFDVQYAKEKGYRIKLISYCKRVDNSIHAVVLPSFVEKTDNLYNVNFEYNGVCLESTFSESQFFSGKGAGSNATGSAVLSDISAITYDYKYEYKKCKQNQDLEFTNDFNIRIYLRYKKEEPIDKTLFSKIDEDFQGNEFAYVCGELNFKGLLSSKFLDRQDVHIIALPDSFAKTTELQEKEMALEQP